MDKYLEIFNAVTLSDVLRITDTETIDEAEAMAYSIWEEKRLSLRGRLAKYQIAIAGIVITYIFSQFLPSIVYIGVIITFIGFIIALLSKSAGQKIIRDKFIEFRTQLKNTEGRPELNITRELARTFNWSLLLSRAAKIKTSGETVSLLNTDKKKHLWDQAGYCKVLAKQGKNAVWQFYYIFVYHFDGRCPHMLLIHKEDTFTTPIMTGSKTLIDVCPPWTSIIQGDYEIEALALLSPDVIYQLSNQSKEEGPCTIEILENNLVCFVPAKMVSNEGLFVSEKIAESFARILLPKLSSTKTTSIGNIALQVENTGEEYEEAILPSPEEKTKFRLTLLSVITCVISMLYALSHDTFPPLLIFLIPVIFSIIIILLLPKKTKKQLLRNLRID